MAVEMAERVAALLAARGETLAVAESATGGLILSLLTDVPGASAWLRGGIVAYTNVAKTDLLGVHAAVLSTQGAVSAQAAQEMAWGARRLFGATWALGETGVAGPQTGRRTTKPAGLSFIAVTGGRDADSIDHVQRYLLENPGDRTAVKRAFADFALVLLYDTLSTAPQ